MENYSQETTALLNRIDSLKQQIDAMQPISKEQHNRIFQKFRLDWNYNSNSIEGNSLNYGETVAFLMEGLTAKGKPLKDHLDIKGHNEAIEFLLDMQKKETELTERDIRALHEMILVEPYQAKAQTADGQETTKIIQIGQYKSSANHVRTATGEIHYYASPEETPVMMHELILWYRENREKLHPLILSALFHHKFVSIHPFDDGNGRMTRLLSNLLLMKAGFPPVVVRQDERREYYGVLSQADAGFLEPLLQFFAERLIASLETYLRGAKGEDISDPADLEKELSLFIASFDEEALAKQELSEDNFVLTVDQSVLPLMNSIKIYTDKLSKLFFEGNITMSVISMSGNSGKKVANYAPVPYNEFSLLWLEEGTLFRAMLEAFRSYHSNDKYLKFVLDYSYSGFKVNENARRVSATLMLDFHRSRYSINNTGALNKEVVKSYPQKISYDEINSITKNFINELMLDIKSADIR